MGGPPPDDVALPAGLTENVPDRLGLSGQVRDGSNAPGVRVGLDESQDAVLEWPLSGDDGRPQHGGQVWIEGGEIAHDS